jgi:CubicO group peptidase (beta-lactamase class C family)
MSWTGGYCMSSAIDIARFWTDLLGHKTIVSAENTEIMKSVTPINDKSFYQYAFGIMEGNMGGGTRFHPSNSTVGKFIGHDGLTYGFGSSQGFFPALNASVSIIQNVDFD